MAATTSSVPESLQQVRQRRRLPVTPYRASVWGLRALFVIGSAAIWEWLVARGTLNGFFFGRPTLIWAQFLERLSDGSLLTHSWVTVSETLLGFFGGMLVGSFFGLLLWFSRRLAEAIDPFLVMWNATPKIALGPMFLIWMGIGYWMKVSLSFSLVFVVAWIVAYDGTRQVDKDLERLMYSLGATRWQVFTKVVVPSALPWIISAFKLCIGLALTGAVVGEFIAANKGLGYLILYASGSYALNLVWVALLTLMVISTVLNLVVGVMENRLLRHQRFGS